MIRFKEIDTFRGLAAIMVVLFHCTMSRPNYDSILRFGITGVELFFILSGFVIFNSILRIENGKKFIYYRITRLYPTYWFSVCLTFSLTVIYALFKQNFVLKEAITQLVGNLTMLQFYLGIPNIDGPYWTLIIELLFYTLIWLLQITSLQKHIILIHIFLSITSVILTNYFLDNPIAAFIIYKIPIFQFIPVFLTGILFFSIYTGRIKKQLGYMLILFSVLCQISLFHVAGYVSHVINQKEYGIMLFIFAIILTLAIENKLAWVINPYTLFLGQVSYPLYLVHQYISKSILIPIFFNKLGFNFWLVLFGITIPLLLLLSNFITKKIEGPSINYFRKRLKLTP